MPEKSHMEPRFSPTDGSRLEDAKVIDEPSHWAYDFKGESYDDEFGGNHGKDIYGLLEAISLACECSFDTYGSHEDRINGCPRYVVFGPELESREEPDARHNFYIGGSITVTELFKHRPHLRRTRHYLKGLGFKPGKARIFTNWSYDN